MVNWTPEKHQILLKEIFQYCDIKMNKELCQHLANVIGEGCTPKAVQNILSNLKNHGRAAGAERTATPSRATPAKPKSALAKSSPAKFTPAKTPSSGGGHGRPKKQIKADGEPTNDLGDHSSPSVGRKRSHTAEATNGTNKKIKTEQVYEDNIFQHEDFFPTAEEDEAAQTEV
ncbi:hypothetical protein P171DRAFT_430605 [Karstenula rhodostoma CBS 690.94]|uniref:Uncharacterized protein n=1 Tax=Karstenula rhodostoma CBS 690.94 TaxID=1392251 RepID=A0A9P4UEQ5_9PLEO|nr:hypothetical protein P171DRAFT_430605 [Karstenula rhodostoma CBS 690.94]